MAHFAKLGTGNVVERIEVISDDIATNEQAGVDFLNNLYGTTDTWKLTSHDASIRKNFAGIGYTYDEDRDAFIPPQPTFASWSLNETTCIWEPPVAYPDDGLVYHWNEDNETWDAAE